MMDNSVRTPWSTIFGDRDNGVASGVASGVAICAISWWRDEPDPDAFQTSSIPLKIGSFAVGFAATAAATAATIITRVNAV
jgi:hypothetical protein